MALFASSLGLLHPLLPPLANAACLAFTGSYVGVLYLVPNARSRPDALDAKDGQPLTRQHPKIIKARMLAVGLSSVASVCGVGALIWHASGGQVAGWDLIGKTLKATGLAISPPLAAIKSLVLPLLLPVTLFLGPFHTRRLDHGLRGLAPWFRQPHEVEDHKGWRGLRNFVFAPLSEEIVFRSCVIATMAMAGASKRYLVFMSPCWFGVAHLHHVWEVYTTGGRTKPALQHGLLQAAFQFGYTTLFGWFASFVFMRTGSVYPAALCHSFCNLMGLPPLAYALQRYKDRRLATCMAYAAGILGFSLSLWPFTEPARYGGSLYWVS